MALLTPVSLPGSAGTTITWTAAAGGGDTIAYRKDKKQVLLTNCTGTGRNITVTAVRTSAQSGRDVAVLTDLVITSGANTIKAWPMTAAYVASTGLISVSYNSVANLSVALIEL